MIVGNNLGQDISFQTAKCFQNKTKENGKYYFTIDEHTEPIEDLEDLPEITEVKRLTDGTWERIGQTRYAFATYNYIPANAVFGVAYDADGNVSTGSLANAIKWKGVIDLND